MSESPHFKSLELIDLGEVLRRSVKVFTDKELCHMLGISQSVLARWKLGAMFVPKSMRGVVIALLRTEIHARMHVPGFAAHRSTPVWVAPRARRRRLR